MNHGRQIRLFLADGSASGLRYYELVNWTGQALRVPVSRIKELLAGEWPGTEFRRPGVYLVKGQTEEGDEVLYIGESEDVAKRLNEHLTKLPLEISEALLFTSKDSNLTKTHVLWLEKKLIEKVRETKQISLQNTQLAEAASLSPPEQATTAEFLENIELIAQTAGFSYFHAPKITPSPRDTDPVAVQPTTPTLTLTSGRVKATATRTDDGFVVSKGSLAKIETSEHLQASYAARRADLIKNEILVQTSDGRHYEFTADTAFPSPSAAAATVVGYNYSGPANWKDGAGTPLKTLLEQSDSAVTG